MKGSFRSIWRSLFKRDNAARLKGPKQFEMPDPVFAPRSIGRLKPVNRQGSPRLGRPPCDPGTITYHDKLVRHFGRREADRIGRAYRAAELKELPF